ncbi:SH3 domain-containing protein [Faunimonas sp. B44]|uniref:SH3 domain-containing protein n=1 Tax=Faunimonas sp. B44 TaxID=3461493 RepID=UPI004044A224
MIRRFALSVLLAAGMQAAAPAAPGPWSAEQAVAQAKGPSGLPLPRFVSLKSSRINVRRGPGQDYDVAFTFVRAGLPVEIVQEFDNWRKVRDAEGDEGWIFHSLLSGRRTAMVAPWEQEGRFAVRAAAGADARVVAYVEPQVMADVESCTGTWCRIRGENYAGWIEQDRLWGVYPSEVFRN